MWSMWAPKVRQQQQRVHTLWTPSFRAQTRRAEGFAPLSARRAAARQRCALSAVTMAGDDYEVAAVVGKRAAPPAASHGSAVEYRVRWLGFGPQDDSWEPVSALRSAKERVRDFERAQQDAGGLQAAVAAVAATGRADAAAAVAAALSSSTITSCEPQWRGTPVRKQGDREYYSGFSLGGEEFALGEFVYLDGGEGCDRMIGRIEQLFEIVGGGGPVADATGSAAPVRTPEGTPEGTPEQSTRTQCTVCRQGRGCCRKPGEPGHLPAAATAKTPSARVKRVPQRYKESLAAKKPAKRGRKAAELMTAAEAECPMFLVVRWCFRFAECFEDTVVSEAWNWGAQLEADRSVNARSEIFISKATNVADVNNIALTVVGKPTVRHVNKILSMAGDAATGTERDRCLKWTQQSPDRFMFRYQFDPETFSFVGVDEAGEGCSTRPPVTSDAPLRFGDCFSGAGGLSLGLQAAGLEQRFAVENNRESQRSFMLSHPPSAKLYRESVVTFLAQLRAGTDGYPCRGEIDVLAGGSPCQPYSLANRHSIHRDDDRTELVFTFLDILEHLEPTFFMLENVPPFLTGHRHHIATKSVPSPLPRVIARLLELGYQARVVLTCSAHYGVPQARQRVFVLASKRGHPLPKAPPPVVHYRHSRGVPGTNDFGQVFIESNESLPTPEDAEMSVLGAIEDLNPLSVDRSVDSAVQNEPPCPHIQSLFLEEAEERDEGDTAVNSRNSTANTEPTDKVAVLGDDVSLYARAPRNAFQKRMRSRLDGTRLDVNAYLHNHWVEMHKDVGGAEHAAKALAASAAAFPTVLGRSTCLHPLYQRPFTVRERARACALPDWVELRGNLAQQATQVGNLVPPPVAEAFGRELLIAAGRRDDDWSARAAAGFGPQSYWGTSAYSERVMSKGNAEPSLHYEAASGETCHSIAKRLGFANGWGLADLNRPIYGPTLQVHARLKHTEKMKVTLLIPTAEANETATAAALARNELWHEAFDNETPLEIAEKVGCSLEALLAANSGDGGIFDHRTRGNSRLKQGTPVLLPAGAAAAPAAPAAAAAAAAAGTDTVGDSVATYVAGSRKRRRVQPERFSQTKFVGSCDRPVKEQQLLPISGSASAQTPAASALAAAAAADDARRLVGKKVRMRVLGHGEHSGRIVRQAPSAAAGAAWQQDGAGSLRLEVRFDDGDVRRYTAAQCQKALLDGS
jgi:DNA (cytosine-5)-methyltransferase 1